MITKGSAENESIDLPSIVDLRVSHDIRVLNEQCDN
jgi:hypothetical protein